jgi:ABC-type Mn2+/Zn2+ transport system permease subunit
VLGITFTFIPFFAVDHSIGSLLFALATVLVFSRLLTGRKIPMDAVLGISFVTSIAARILILQKTPKVEAAEIEALLRGDILFITPGTFHGMLAVFVVVMLLHILFFKEFSFVAFDRETAQTAGYRTAFWELLFYLSAGVTISVATHMVGDIFVFGFLVMPAVTGMLLLKRVRSIFLLAAFIGAVAPVLGLTAAFMFDVPSAPAIVAVAALFLFAAWGYSLLRR